MDYVGLDPTVGLECGGCKHIVRLPYSELLTKVIDVVPMSCDGCGHAVEHDWTTINIVQNIIRRRMREAQKAERSSRYPDWFVEAVVSRSSASSGRRRVASTSAHHAQHERVLLGDFAQRVVATGLALVARAHVGLEQQQVVIGLQRSQLRDVFRGFPVRDPRIVQTGGDQHRRISLAPQLIVRRVRADRIRMPPCPSIGLPHSGHSSFVSGRRLVENRVQHVDERHVRDDRAPQLRRRRSRPRRSACRPRCRRTRRSGLRPCSAVGAGSRAASMKSLNVLVRCVELAGFVPARSPVRRRRERARSRTQNHDRAATAARSRNSATSRRRTRRSHRDTAVARRRA